MSHRISIQVKNFRVLKKTDWSPSGVSLLCGPNGAGKSTMLDTLIFLRSVFQFGMEAALSHVKGGGHLRTLGLPDETPVDFSYTFGDNDVRWKLKLPVDVKGQKSNYGEELYRGDTLVLRAGMYQNEWFLGKEKREFDSTRCCAKWLWDRGDSLWMKPLADALLSIRVYKSYWMNQVFQSPVDDGPFDGSLHWTGRNLWRVLQAWKGSPIKYRNQFSWVLDACKRAFPESIAAIEIEQGQPAIFLPGFMTPNDGLPPRLIAEGVLTGLLHLTAIAGAPNGTIVAIDEMENQLHPHAIRSILSSMREIAEERDLTIILTTHSPVLMNEFKGDEGHFLVMEQGIDGTLPVPLTAIHDPEWLAHFALGDLYDREEFASPRAGAK